MPDREADGPCTGQYQQTSIYDATPGSGAQSAVAIRLSASPWVSTTFAHHNLHWLQTTDLGVAIYACTRYHARDFIVWWKGSPADAAAHLLLLLDASRWRNEPDAAAQARKFVHPLLATEFGFNAAHR